MKESKGIKVVVGFFVLILAAGILSTIGIGLRLLFFIIPAGIAAIAYIKNGVANPTVMVINKTGFYYYGEMITNWTNFIDAEFIDDVPVPDGSSSAIQDRFYMMIRYYKDGEAGYYGRKIPFTDTQDRSEEEIIAAVKFYHANYTKAST